MKWPGWLPKVSVGKEKLSVVVHGRPVPDDAELVKCELCRSVVPDGDDFAAHGRYHAAVQYTHVQAVADLLEEK